MSDPLVDHLQECLGLNAVIVATDREAADAAVTALAGDGYVLDHVEHVMGKRIRIMRRIETEVTS